MRRRRSISPRPALIKHTPQRTCIACRKVTGKRELIRLVRTANGSVEVDVSGREAGRGAYLCRSWECWKAGLKGGQLERRLRTTLTADNRQQLISCGEELILGVSGGESR
jgi:predicted RNA-binding protein YlxR (DUF448 family)